MEKLQLHQKFYPKYCQKDKNKDYEHIDNAINDFINVQSTTNDYPFKRTIDKGERSVLNLANELNADILIIDDRKARNEAVEMKIKAFLAYTTDILKQAENDKIISSYKEIQIELKQKNIYLPDLE